MTRKTIETTAGVRRRRPEALSLHARVRKAPSSEQSTSPRPNSPMPPRASGYRNRLEENIMNRNRDRASKKDSGGVSKAALVPVSSGAEMTGRTKSGGVVILREGGTSLLIDRPYVMRDRTITAQEIYFVDGAKPAIGGEWLGEADKVAWRDEVSGYECIMMRETDGGYLAGYVGVPRSHPLYGFEADAIPPEIGIEVHGGLTYSRVCQEGPTPERRIAADARRVCHVPRASRMYEPTAHATGYRVEDAHAWWFGFACNHTYDVIPNRKQGSAGFLGPEVGGVYRDDAYVCTEVLNLAAQLCAIEDGAPMPSREGPPLPPIGLDSDIGG